MLCMIFEIYLLIISSGIAWCHHATGEYLVIDGHGQLPNEFVWNPTILKCSSSRAAGVRLDLCQRCLSRSKLGDFCRAPGVLYVAGKLFVFNRFKPNLVCPLVSCLNDHPPNLREIGLL